MYWILQFFVRHRTLTSLLLTVALSAWMIGSSPAQQLRTARFLAIYVFFPIQWTVDLTSRAQNIFAENERLRARVAELNTRLALVEESRAEAARVERLRATAPELFAGGGSLLEIGSNKGYFCLALAGLYKSVTVYDKASEYVALAKRVVLVHRIPNIAFHHGAFRDVPFDKTYDVVYVGNCHHYFFFDCARAGAPPFLFLKKLAGLTGKYLIIDGPFEMQDPAVTKLSREGSWSPDVCDLYTFARCVAALKPQFELVRKADNGLGRETAVFRRIGPDLPRVDGALLRQKLIREAVPLECNPNRGPDSMFLYRDRRYKFHQNPPPDGVYLILNALPNVVRTHAIIEYRGARIGDVTDWIYGEELDSKHNPKLLDGVLRLEAALGSVGLIELDVERANFKRHGERIIDIDMDMVRHIGCLVSNKPGSREALDFLIRKIGRIGLSEEARRYLRAHITAPGVFSEIAHWRDQA